MKTLVLLLMLVVAISVNAQDVFIYHASLAEFTTTNDWGDAESGDVSDDAIYVVVDLDDEIIKITNTFEDKFIIMTMDSEDYVDAQGYERKAYIIDCLDKDGVECVLRINWYVDDDIGFAGLYNYRIAVLYSNMWYRYYCNLK